VICLYEFTNVVRLDFIVGIISHKNLGESKFKLFAIIFMPQCIDKIILSHDNYRSRSFSRFVFLHLSIFFRHCWESLADAYLAKGAYTSALKCYEKTSSLSQEALYPLLQMAHIKQVNCH
jgi:hypothetical protein